LILQQGCRLFAKLELLHFAVGGHGKRIHEKHILGDLVARAPAAAIVLNLGCLHDRSASQLHAGRDFFNVLLTPASSKRHLWCFRKRGSARAISRRFDSFDGSADPPSHHAAPRPSADEKLPAPRYHRTLLVPGGERQRLSRTGFRPPVFMLRPEPHSRLYSSSLPVVACVVFALERSSS
jgi:hypothetical protein